MEYVTGAPVNVPANGFAQSFAECPSPKTVIGGGGRVNATQLRLSNMPPTPTRWTVGAQSANNAIGNVTAIAICA